jgi:hypothetical protein
MPTKSPIAQLAEPARSRGRRQQVDDAMNKTQPQLFRSRLHRDDDRSDAFEMKNATNTMVRLAPASVLASDRRAALTTTLIDQPPCIAAHATPTGREDPSDEKQPADEDLDRQRR